MLIGKLIYVPTNFSGDIISTGQGVLVKDSKLIQQWDSVMLTFNVG